MCEGEGTVENIKAREPQVAEQCSVLDKSIGSLRASVDALESRIERVMRSSSNPPDSNKEIPRKTLCPLAEWIREKSDEIESLAYRISGLTNRIEL